MSVGYIKIDALNAFVPDGSGMNIVEGSVKYLLLFPKCVIHRHHFNR